MSYYESLSGSCKCMSGYVVDEDIFGNQSCVLADSICHEQLGIMSRYNSLNKTCECSYGYTIYNGQCVSENDMCTSLYGYGARYNILTDLCECRSGYSYNGSRCEYDSSNGSYFDLTPTTPSFCPLHSTLHTDGSCYCDTGYQVNTDKTSCAAITCQEHAILIGSVCLCDDGYIFRDGQCLSYTQDCQVVYGEHVYGIKNDASSSCFCENGYQWNNQKTVCLLTESTSSVTQPTLSGAGDEQNQTLAEERLRGRILLQVQSHGEAWYVNEDGRRYYMRDGAAAFTMMRSFGLGITNGDLEKIPVLEVPEDAEEVTSVCSSNSIAKRLGGKILLQVELNGEAWYVHPDTCRRIYLKNGDAAYSTMRYLSLGITNSDIGNISIGTLPAP